MKRVRSRTSLRSWAPRVALALLGTVAVGCSSNSDDDDDDQSGGAAASSGGSLNFGGFSAYGGFSALGGFSAYGGFTSAGGSTSVGGSAGAPGKGGGKGGNKGDASGGAASGVGGSVGASGSAATIPPPPGPGGKSPYLPECKGDTRSCGDVVNLTCLGIKDPVVRGFTCSSSCQVDSDCSMAPSGFAARTGCVDFAVAKHCLFICLERGEMSACPTGMGCYVYTGSPVGYCLWPP